MRTHDTDVKSTLEYGQTHDMARKAVPWTLGAIAIGLFILSEPTGSSSQTKDILLGVIVILGALVFLAILIHRRTQPSVPNLVVSEQGIIYRIVSDQVIPWGEIGNVTPAQVSASRDFFSTKVVRLEVSPAFYERYTQGKWLDSTTGEGGNPSAIYLAYALDVPHEELLAAVSRRWRAFSLRAKDVAPVDAYTRSTAKSDAADDNRPLAGSRATASSRRSVMERASSFEGLHALVALFGGGSFGRALINLAALGLILALLTNILGYWATDTQLKRRAESAKWKAWQAERDREQREFDENQKRIKEKFDRMFACMDETFRRHDLGIGGDPKCAKEKD